MNKYNARNLDRFFKLVTELIFFIAVMVTVETEINNNIVLDHQFKLTQNEIKHWHKKHIALCWPTLGCWKWASLIKTFGWHVLAASGTCSTRWKMCHSRLLNCWPRGIVQNKYWVDLMEYKDWMGFIKPITLPHISLIFRAGCDLLLFFFLIRSPILFGNNGTELTKLEETYGITKQICRNPTPPKTISTWTGRPDLDDISRKWKSCNLLLGHSKNFLFLLTVTFDLCSCTTRRKAWFNLEAFWIFWASWKVREEVVRVQGLKRFSSLLGSFQRRKASLFTGSFCCTDCSFLQEISSY